ncbi:MAG TPA: hypothetical protein PLR26_05190 [Bacilli bacterium]|nr:hypothetical protein [Bacilli bacterium]
MIQLDRRKNHKWIMQKNVSSKNIIEAYLDVISSSKSSIDYDEIKRKLKVQSIYKGRTNQGSISTMGVRFSQMCFYMFGYKNNSRFIPSPMTLNLLNPNCPISKESNALINLFTMQFPHPYSQTNQNFYIYIGRLFIKLLLDERIERKLYIDEMIWFLPFIETIDESIYEDLIGSIIEYRNLTYYLKDHLFKNVKNNDDIFSNTTHEMNYYFLRIFKGFGVFDVIPDRKHNDGMLFRFHHGNQSTYRTDAYDSNKSISGYIKLSDLVIADAVKLNENFSAFEKPTTMTTIGVNSRRDWFTALYDTEPLAYLNCITNVFNREKEISDIVNTMVYASKYGSHDGKEFETSLKPLIELFRETCNVEIISGSGNTDLLCVMENENEDIYKMNVDAKTRKAGLSDINARRLEIHLKKYGSKFCIVVAPRFASGISGDIHGYNIVTIKAEELGAYCYKECTNSEDGYADFESLHQIIRNNIGSDITENVNDLMIERYGIEI